MRVCWLWEGRKGGVVKRGAEGGIDRDVRREGGIFSITE